VTDRGGGVELLACGGEEGEEVAEEMATAAPGVRLTKMPCSRVSKTLWKFQDGKRRAAEPEAGN
jgi:hypothetical protein